MRVQLSIVLVAIALLTGCQSLNQAWTRATAATSKTSTTPPPAAAAKPTATAGTAASGEPGQPIHSSTPLRSFKIANHGYADETRDFGTPPVSALIPPSYHGPTPVTLAGGRLITTYRLRQMLVAHRVKPVLINTRTSKSTENIPGSVWLGGAGQNGTFSGLVQARLARHLKKLTGGDKRRPLVFYCTNVRCWSAYDAALRAVNLDYRNVYWYRGGLRAWYAAGLPTVTATRNQW